MQPSMSLKYEPSSEPLSHFCEAVVLKGSFSLHQVEDLRALVVDRRVSSTRQVIAES